MDRRVFFVNCLILGSETSGDGIFEEMFKKILNRLRDGIRDRILSDFIRFFQTFENLWKPFENLPKPSKTFRNHQKPS